jgi:hypothetical protein
MTIRTCRFSLVLLISTAFVAPAAKAGLLVAGSVDMLSVATMDLTLLANTPFNPTGSNIYLTGVSGTGVLTFTYNAETANGQLTGAISGGMYVGSNPLLGNYVFGNVGDLTGSDFNAVINNVVQNSNDPGFATGQASSFQSGQFVLGGDSFGFQFIGGPVLYTDPTVPFQFTGTLDGLPPSGNASLQNSATDVLNVLFNGQVVAQSYDRTIHFLPSAVPEPASLLMVGIGVLGVTGFARARKAWGRAV